MDRGAADPGPDGTEGESMQDADRAGRAGGREWTHPSELGLHRRVQSDRRRSRHMVLVLVGVAGGVLLATAMLARHRSETEATVLGGTRADVEFSVVPAHVRDGDGTHVAPALVIDSGRYAVLSGADLGAGAEMTVTATPEGASAERAVGATVLAKDAVTDLVLLWLSEPVATQPGDLAQVEVGDVLEHTSFDDGGDLRRSAATVSALDAQAVRPNGSVAMDLIAAWGDDHEVGPLTDDSGRLAGWVMGAQGDQMMAYPTDTLMAAVEELLVDGRTRHGWIGVRAASADGADGGAEVLSVRAGSPAEAAGIMAGDVIRAVGGTPVSDLGALVEALKSSGAGESVLVVVSREGRDHEMTVTVGQFPD